jgi:hypothetical protein
LRRSVRGTRACGRGDPDCGRGDEDRCGPPHQYAATASGPALRGTECGGPLPSRPSAGPSV